MSDDEARKYYTELRDSKGHELFSGNSIDVVVDHLTNELVPSYGKAPTKLGEMLRAANRITYKLLNDGEPPSIQKEKFVEFLRDIYGVDHDRTLDDPYDLSVRWLNEVVAPKLGLTEDEFENVIQDLRYHSRMPGTEYSKLDPENPDTDSLVRYLMDEFLPMIYPLYYLGYDEENDIDYIKNYWVSKDEVTEEK